MMQQVARLSCLAAYRHSSIVTHPCHGSARGISTSKQHNYKVTVIGAAGYVGQSLSLLLRLNPLVTELNLIDTAEVTPNIAVDLAQMESGCKVRGHNDPVKLALALKNANVIVISTGGLRRPGMTADDVFKTNANFIVDVIYAIARYSPEAFIALVTNPLNSCVPIAAEVLKEECVYSPNRLFGVTMLDTVRSRTFIGDALGIDSTEVQIPVIGGQSSATIIPVISECSPPYKARQYKIRELTKRIQNGGGSATLSMAYACSCFVDSLLRGLSGEEGVIECAYVDSNVTEARFFSTPLRLGRWGIEENFGLPHLNDFEQSLLEDALPVLQKDIEMGRQYIKDKKYQKAKEKMLAIEQFKKEKRKWQRRNEENKDKENDMQIFPMGDVPSTRSIGVEN